MRQDLSISFLVYNNSEFIYDNLRNLVDALPPAYFCCLYVIDNCSKDGSWQEILRFEKHLRERKEDYGHVDLELIKNPANVGFGRGHNVLLERLDSRYHLVMNPDIRVEGSEQLEAMMCYLDEHSDTGLLVPLLKNADDSIQHLCKRNPTLIDLLVRRWTLPIVRRRQDTYTMMDSGYDHVMDVEYASGCFMLFKTNIFREVDGFDERFFLYLEDADITRRVNQVSRTEFFPHAWVTHDWYRGTYRSPKLFLINVHSVLLYFSKWGWKLW